MGSGPYTSGVIFVLVAGAFAAILIADLGSASHFECSLCIEFEGHENCDRGQGALRHDAIQSAKSVACAALTSGMGEAFRCKARPATQVRCRER